jgi:hypothetical protein
MYSTACTCTSTGRFAVSLAAHQYILTNLPYATLPGTLLDPTGHVIAQISLTAIVLCIVCMLGAYSIQRVAQSHQRLRHVAVKAMGSYTYQWPRPALTVDTVIGEQQQQVYAGSTLHDAAADARVTCSPQQIMPSANLLQQPPVNLDACSLPSNPGSTI